MTALKLFGLQPPALVAATLAIFVAGCGSMAPRMPASPPPPSATHGGYYLNDGPDSHPPANLDQVPDAVPRSEPLKSGAMKPYTVLGQTYTPLTELAPYKARGIASWYGRRYNGQKTASGEPYDMYAMTAAHPTLPIPSYARVTNLVTGKSVIVRINDRGPFLADRLIDLSYTAAYKLGVLNGGQALVEVESIVPGQAPSVTPDVDTAMTTRNLPVARVAVPTSAEISPAIPISAVSPSPAVFPSITGSETTPPDAVTTDTTVLPPMPTVALTRDARGIFLQLGAFDSEANAENYLAKLRLQIDVALAQTLRVYQKGDGLFRVHLGPYATQNDARQAVERLAQSLGIKAIVVSR